MKHLCLAWEVFHSEDEFGPQTGTFREDFAVNTLDHSDKSDSGALFSKDTETVRAWKAIFS